MFGKCLDLFIGQPQLPQSGDLTKRHYIEVDTVEERMFYYLVRNAQLPNIISPQLQNLRVKFLDNPTDGHALGLSTRS